MTRRTRDERARWVWAFRRSGRPAASFCAEHGLTVGSLRRWEPVDVRLGIERLGAVVRERMRREPRSRALFVFVGKRRQSLKVLSWDGTGMVLWYEKLDRGLFELPRPSVSVISPSRVSSVKRVAG